MGEYITKKKYAQIVKCARREAKELVEIDANAKFPYVKIKERRNFTDWLACIVEIAYKKGYRSGARKGQQRLK